MKHVLIKYAGHLPVFGVVWIYFGSECCNYCTRNSHSKLLWEKIFNLKPMCVLEFVSSPKAGLGQICLVIHFPLCYKKEAMGFCNFGVFEYNGEIIWLYYNIPKYSWLFAYCKESAFLSFCRWIPNWISSGLRPVQPSFGYPDFSIRTATSTHFSGICRGREAQNEAFDVFAEKCRNLWARVQKTPYQNQHRTKRANQWPA